MTNQLLTPESARAVLLNAISRMKPVIRPRNPETFDDATLGRYGRLIWLEQRQKQRSTLLEQAFRLALRTPSDHSYASFWLHHPADYRKRVLVGSTVSRGQPRANSVLTGVSFIHDFTAHVLARVAVSDDWQAHWQFAWSDDVFATDYTYALINGMVHVAHFRKPFRHLAEELLADQPDTRADDPQLASGITVDIHDCGYDEDTPNYGQTVHRR